MDYYYYEQDGDIVREIVEKKVMESITVLSRTDHVKYLKIPAGFDIETTDILVSVELHTAYCYHWQFGFDDIAIMGRKLDSMLDFFEYLIEVINYRKPKCKLLVFDANLGYEWQFCKSYWNQLQITKVFAKEERDPLSIQLKNTIDMREVLGLFGKSLAQIAKNYCGMEKLVGDLDYSKIRLSNTPMTDKEIGYCVRDVEILCKLASGVVYKNFFGNKPKLPYTSTGLIRDAIKREYGANLKAQKELIKSWMPDDEEEYEIFRRYLFKGGISGSNIKLADKVLEHVMGADITSDYPFQMLTKRFPMGKATVINSSEFMKENKPYIATIVFHKFRSKSQHAIMSAHKALNSREMIRSEDTILDNNRVQYADRIVLVINDIEYKSLKKAYKWDHAIVKKCWVFNEGYKKLPNEIRKVVIKQYLVKEELKAEYSNTQEYKDAKAFVNGIFGMMCTALYFEDLAFIEDTCLIGLDKRRAYEDCINNLFLSPYWGFWITSYAREMLIDVITRFPEVIIQYDTDSVYFINNEVGQKLRNHLQARNESYMTINDILFQHNKRMRKLGTWDITDEFQKFKGLGSKRYMYLDKDGDYHVTIAGCRKYTVEDENDPNYKKERSTMMDQLEHDDLINGTKTDPFDFFTEGMFIHPDHSKKLASTYVDKRYVIDYTDEDGNVERIDCPSAIVLTPIPFTMKFGRMGITKKTYGDLLIAVRRFEMNSSQGRKVYDIWRQLKG